MHVHAQTFSQTALVKRTHSCQCGSVNVMHVCTCVKGDTVSVKPPAAGGDRIPVVSCIAIGAYFDSALGALILVHAVGDARYPHAKATPRAVCEGNKRLHVGKPGNDTTTLVSIRHECKRQQRHQKRSKEKVAQHV